MGVRRRDPGLACFRSGLPSVFAGCLERGFDAFSAVATAVSGAAPDSAFEVPAAAGFFLPLPPRLPRRRLFFGPAGEPSSSAGSVAWGSGGASTSVTAASGTASSCCCLPKRNQRSAKCEFLSCDRARAQDGHRPDRPRAACCQDIGRHDLPTGYQSASGDSLPQRRSSGGGPKTSSSRAHRAKALREPRPRPGLELGVPRLHLAASGLEILEPGVGFLELQELLGKLGVRHHTHALDRAAS